MNTEVNRDDDNNTIRKEIFNHNELTKIKEKRDFFADQYLDRVTDLIKYTTSLSFAAILWIGGSFSSFYGLARILVLISLFFLFISIYVSITIFFNTIRYSSMNLASYQVMNDFFCGSWDAVKAKTRWSEEQMIKINQILPITSEISENFDFFRLKEDLDKFNQSKPITEARLWDLFVRLHIYSIFFGFLFYIFAIFANSAWNII